MSGTTVILAVRSGIAAMKDRRTRTVLGTVLCALFMPVILIVLAILAMADGAAQHNRASVMACFDSTIPISAAAPAEYQTHVTQMRSCFAEIDTAADALEIPEDAPALDLIRVKAIFYWLHYERSPLSLSAEQATAFVDCFVEYEEREREVPTPSATPMPTPASSPAPSAAPDAPTDEQPATETYLAAIPLTDLPTIFAHVGSWYGHALDFQTQSACLEIYYMVRYGDASLAGNTDDLLDVIIDGSSDYIGGVAGSPFTDDWRSHVSSEFGGRCNPITGAWEGHRGIDLRNAAGTPIRAVASGTVVLARYGHPSYGNYVVLDHGGGTTSLYAHCSTLLVTTGQTVAQGDAIAKVGSTGDSTGNHLHLEIKVNGTLVDPRSFLP